MYVPKHFATSDEQSANNIIAANPFAILISAAAQATISHIPLVRLNDGTQHGALVGHLAKPNPHALALDGKTPAVAVFSGPHAYVSPNWYETPNMVPTWNYAAVHVHGTPHAIEDTARATRIIENLVDAFENEETGNWTTAALTPGRMAGQLKGIVAFEMPIERIETKLKMSQNRSAADVGGVIDALSNSRREPDRETAKMMQAISDRPEMES